MNSSRPSAMVCKIALASAATRCAPKSPGSKAAEGDACPLCDGAAFDCPACGGPAELSEELRVAAARHELWLWAQEQKLGERWAAEMEAQSQCEHPGQALEDWQRIGAGWRARCGLCGEGVEI